MAKGKQEPVARPKVPETKPSNLPSPEVLDDFEKLSGVGLENVGVRDVLIPRLAIMQTLSYQLKRNRPQYIEGAKEGDICDVGMKEIIGDKCHFLLCHYNKVWIEWAPRDTGRGIVRIHSDDRILAECGLDDRKRPITEDGNIVQETAQFYGLNLDKGMRASFIAMPSTQLKVGRHWMTLATGEKLPRKDGSLYQAPIFYRSYLLGTQDVTDGDNDWKLWTVERHLSLPELFPDVTRMRYVMQECKLINEQLAKGMRRGDLRDLEDEQDVARTTVVGTRRRPPPRETTDVDSENEPM